MTRHEGANVNCSSPDVVVSSEYVPSALRSKFRSPGETP